MASYPHIITLPNTLNSKPLADICDGLNKPKGEKTLPTILLYDERGLRLYDDITTKAPEYYLFAAEEQLLRDNGIEIVRLMHGGSPVRNGEFVLELGAGALRKTSLLLKALAQASPVSTEPAVTYLALDLEKRELDRTLSFIASSDLGPELTNRVRIGGLCGTYDDGIAFVRQGGLNDVHSSPALTASSLDTASESKIAENLTEETANLETNLKKDPGDEAPFSLGLSTDSADLNGPLPSDEQPSPLTPSESPSTYSEYDETPPLHFLFLGSSIGNFTREGAAEFLKSLPLRPWSNPDIAAGGGAIGDTLLLGLDHDNDPKLIETAYNDPAGHTTRFIMNGLAGVRKLLVQGGMPEAAAAFEDKNWSYQEHYNTVDKRHEGRYLSEKEQHFMLGTDKVEFAKGETIHIEHSYKYSESAAQDLFNAANLKPIHRWISSNGLYSLWLLHRPAFTFPIVTSRISKMASESVKPDIMPQFPIEKSANFPTIPTLDEWANMWKLWDTVTLGMIPEPMLMQAPIDLRHKCLFYLGHIPTFLDIHLSRLLKEPHTEPDEFKYIFERGIDPHVDDPTKCHPHSKVPEKDDEWPVLEAILAFRDRVRTRLRSVYERLLSGDLSKAGISARKAQRVLWMTYEHEAFHVETLLYMLIQKAGEDGGTRPPPGVPPPDWEALQIQWNRRKELESTQETKVTLGPCVVSVGHDDLEADDYQSETLYGEEHEFGWDNEHPKRDLEVKKFTIERKPISNGEYHQFWSTKEGTKPPASWIVKDSVVQVRTLYGPVPLSVARDWPLIASYEELNAYALSKGGRIPTQAELRLFMDDQASRGLVNAYNNAGWGYQRWWFEPPSLGNPVRNEAPHNGGVWELTSTIMDKHEGFEPSILYPGYSSDFFDGVHHIVLGGSFATIPRLAQRRSLVNYYQYNYPYAWTGARIAYDA